MKSDYKNRVPEGPSRWGRTLEKLSQNTIIEYLQYIVLVLGSIII